MTSGVGAVSLDVGMKIQILDTIAKSIYSDPKVKIREAVANSMDNKASWFILYADNPSLTITLMDNGTGITRTRFEEILRNLGCGTKTRQVFQLLFWLGFALDISVR